MKLKPFLQGFGMLAITLTLVPIIAADFWWIRMFDYPHTQLTILTFVALVIYFARFNIKLWQDYAFVGVLTGCFLFQLVTIYPYLPHQIYDVGDADPENKKERHIKIFSANVLQKNTNSEILISEIAEQDPDIILLTETDAKWKNYVSAATEQYPYKIEVPLDNTYGLLFYSRIQLSGTSVEYLVDDSIPSVHTTLNLPSGEDVRLFAIHPTPPMPQHNPSSTDRDAEMMIVAKKAMESEIPVVVIGDFNDVAWSGTTTMFQNISGLLDVRVGRGFYNSFDATSNIMRWPLDQYFVSEEFRVVELKTGKKIDSDHFPVYVTLSLETEKAAEQRADPPSQNLLDRANQQIEEARKEQREKKENGE